MDQYLALLRVINVGGRNKVPKLSQSRMSRIVTTPVYRYMTIRNWNTTRKLLAMLDESP